MNKRGFIRVLEAVIAIIIVFVYVVNILPDAPKSTGEIPPELDNTLNAVLKEIQNDPEFREAVVVDRDMNQVANFIETSLPPFSPWRFAFRICTSGTEDCGYFFPDLQGQRDTSVDEPGEFNPRLVETGTAIYTKSTFLSRSDPTAPGIANVNCPRTNPASCPLPEEDACCENQVISLYIWSNL